MTGLMIRSGAAALLLLGGVGSAAAQPNPPPAQTVARDPWSAPPAGAPEGGVRSDPGRRGGPRIFVSPAGEVYRPGPGEAPFANWFRRADADGDGAISWDEFRADFARVFATFDTDGDGEIEPEEVTRYETELLPEMSATYGFGTRGTRAGWGGGERRRGSRGGGANDPNGERMGADRGAGAPQVRERYSASLTGAARFGLLPIPHPIMEADQNFNRGVTREEWERAAQRRFTALDYAHNGRLTVDSLLQGRVVTMGEGPRPDRHGPRVAGGAGGTPLPRE